MSMYLAQSTFSRAQMMTTSSATDATPPSMPLDSKISLMKPQLYLPAQATTVHMMVLPANMATMAFLRLYLSMPSSIISRSSGRGVRANRKITAIPCLWTSSLAVSSRSPYFSSRTLRPPLPIRQAENSPMVEPAPQATPRRTGFSVAPNAYIVMMQGTGKKTVKLPNRLMAKAPAQPQAETSWFIHAHKSKFFTRSPTNTPSHG